MRLSKKAVLGAAVALAFSAAAQADPILFNPAGTGLGGASTVNTFDWAPGNALAVGPVPITAGSVGTAFQLLYQANLGTVYAPDTVTKVHEQGAGGNYFTIIANFTESIAAVGVNSVTFGTAAAPVTNFFSICAQTANGNPLAGTGFGCASPILTGRVIVSDGVFSLTGGGANTALDQFINNDWVGTGTVTGVGGFSIQVLVESFNAGYFPGFDPTTDVVFSLFNGNNELAFAQVDPSKCFSTDGKDVPAACNAANAKAPNLGAVNGISGPDFLFQSDSNGSFKVQQIPEPGGLALLGAALGVVGLVARRRSAKGAR